MFLQLACLLVLSTLANGVVHFSKSSLYDNYDFPEKSEVSLPRCNNGCLIFASVNVSAKLDAYMKKLVVHDSTTGNDLSIAAIAAQVQAGTSQKLPYDLTKKGTYSIRNLNKPEDISDSAVVDIAVYVVDRATSLAIDYEIHDANTFKRATVAPKSVVTVMSAKRFVVKADKGEANSYTARLTGFDNALDVNADECTYAYKAPQLDGFEFHVNGPIISLVFDKKAPVALKANSDWQNVRKLDKAGFIAPPGFHGCGKVDPTQVFRQYDEMFVGEEFDLHADNNVNVSWAIEVNLAQDLVVKDMTNSKRNAVKGVDKNVQIVMPATKFATVYYNGAVPVNGFIARYTPTRA